MSEWGQNFLILRIKKKYPYGFQNYGIFYLQFLVLNAYKRSKLNTQLSFIYDFFRKWTKMIFF